MPIADALFGFRASFVMLILGAAGAWCIHGTVFRIPVLKFKTDFAAWWHCVGILVFLGNP